MYFIGKEADTNRILELEKRKNEFMGIVRQAVEKYGVPESSYMDTGGKIVVMYNNVVKAGSSVNNAHCKNIEKFFREFTKE